MHIFGRHWLAAENSPSMLCSDCLAALTSNLTSSYCDQWQPTAQNADKEFHAQAKLSVRGRESSRIILTHSILPQS